MSSDQDTCPLRWLVPEDASVLAEGTNGNTKTMGELVPKLECDGRSKRGKKKKNKATRGISSASITKKQADVAPRSCSWFTTFNHKCFKPSVNTSKRGKSASAGFCAKHAPIIEPLLVADSARCVLLSGGNRCSKERMKCGYHCEAINLGWRKWRRVSSRRLRTGSRCALTSEKRHLAEPSPLLRQSENSTRIVPYIQAVQSHLS